MTERFFEEILLSYRLIFGQDERSWRAFTHRVPVWQEQRGRSTWENAWDCDPMLHLLCGRSSSDPDARKVYDEIDVHEPTKSYDTRSEFLYFGERLVELHQFSRLHQPQSLMALLGDRRDVAAWYNLWNNQVRNSFHVHRDLCLLRS